jgi:adenylate kinase family enzyme
MAVVTSGLDWQGKPCQFFLNDTIKKNLDLIIPVVKNKNFDYVSIISGLPGTGKSTLAVSLAKYCCPWFDKSYICFTGQQFVDVTTNCDNNSSVVLDESFVSLNSKITMSKEYISIINHLQIIRQKNLFIFLCLPNFFDLSKGIAIYRSSHLFDVYGETFGERGRVAVFDRDAKRMLYILGQKFMNYQATKPNFRATFSKQKAIDQEDYDKMKTEHLKQQIPEKEEDKTWVEQRNKIMSFCHEEHGTTIEKFQEITGLGRTSVFEGIRKGKK